MKRGLLHVGLRIFAATIPKSPGRLVVTDHADTRILIQNVSGIGNALMATPLLAEMRRLYPLARIDFVTSPASAQVLATNPHLNTVLTSPDRGRLRPSEYVRLLRELRKARYDAAFVVIPTVGFSHGIRTVLARIPLRVTHGYAFKPEDDFTKYFTRVVSWDQTRHDVESNLDLLRATTRSEITAGPLELALPVEQIDRARRELMQRGWNGGALAGFCPGSEALTAFKRWPLESFARLGSKLLAETSGLTLAVLCGPHEKDCAAYLQENLPRERVLIVQDLPLLTYCAVLGQCSVVVSADSLPVHVCAALRTPLVALFGPTSPRRTGPWMACARVLTAPGEFAPSYSVPYSRPEEIKPCMHLIGVDEVLTAAMEFLNASK